MNNLIPFSRPTFYTPKNLGGTNSLNNLVQNVNTPNYQSQNALTAIYNPNPDNSTDGNHHGTPMSEMSLSEAMQSMAALDSTLAQAALAQMPMGIQQAMNAMAASDAGISANNALSTMSPAAFSGQIGQMSDASKGQLGMAIGGSSGMSVGQVNAAAENATMGMTPGMATAAALGFGVGTGDISAPSQDIGISGDVGIGGGQGISGAAASGNNAATQDATDPQAAPTGNVADGQGSISGHDTGPGSGDAGPTVICTELHRQQLMPNFIWRADCEFAKTVDMAARRGYLMWGIPVVNIMQKSKAFTHLVNILAKPWSRHMAFLMGAEKKDNLIGRALMAVGLPVCRFIGRNTINSPINPPKPHDNCAKPIITAQNPPKPYA